MLLACLCKGNNAHCPRRKSVNWVNTQRFHALYPQRRPGSSDKRWPTDLAVAVSVSRPGGCENLFNRKRGHVAHSLSLLLSHRPDMTEILL